MCIWLTAGIDKLVSIILINFALVHIERTAAISIVDKLGALPLALDQAGSYISSAQIPYHIYLTRFDRGFARIVAKRPPNSVWKYREDTIFTTWEISFAALSPGAQALILLCGFLDNEDIWEELLFSENLKAEYGIGKYPPCDIRQ